MTATVKPLHSRRTPGIKTRRALKQAVDCRTPPPGPVISSPRPKLAGVSSSSGGVESRHAADDPVERGVGQSSLDRKPSHCGIAAASRVSAAKSASAVLPRTSAEPQSAAGVAPGPLTHQPSGKAFVHPGEGNEGASNGPLDPPLIRFGMWWVNLGAVGRMGIALAVLWIVLGVVALFR